MDLAGIWSARERLGPFASAVGRSPATRVFPVLGRARPPRTIGSRYRRIRRCQPSGQAAGHQPANCEFGQILPCWSTGPDGTPRRGNDHRTDSPTRRNTSADPSSPLPSSGCERNNCRVLGTTTGWLRRGRGAATAVAGAPLTATGGQRGEVDCESSGRSGCCEFRLPSSEPNTPSPVSPGEAVPARAAAFRSRVLRQGSEIREHLVLDRLADSCLLGRK